MTELSATGRKAYVTGHQGLYMLVVPLGLHKKARAAFDCLGFKQFPTYRGAQHIANAVNAFNRRCVNDDRLKVWAKQAKV